MFSSQNLQFQLIGFFPPEFPATWDDQRLSVHDQEVGYHWPSVNQWDGGWWCPLSWIQNQIPGAAIAWHWSTFLVISDLLRFFWGVDQHLAMTFTTFRQHLRVLSMFGHGLFVPKTGCYVEGCCGDSGQSTEADSQASKRCGLINRIFIQGYLGIFRGNTPQVVIVIHNPMIKWYHPN